MKRVGTTLIAALILVSVFIAPVMAMGPAKSKGGKVIHIPDYDPKNKNRECYMIISSRGWRQWKVNKDKFAIHLFTEGMNQEAIDSHVADGWTLITLGRIGDQRLPYLIEDYEPGDSIEVLWKSHFMGEE